jgi:hypothetical protein
VYTVSIFIAVSKPVIFASESQRESRRNPRAEKALKLRASSRQLAGHTGERACRLEADMQVAGSSLSCGAGGARADCRVELEARVQAGAWSWRCARAGWSWEARVQQAGAWSWRRACGLWSEELKAPVQGGAWHGWVEAGGRAPYGDQVQLRLVRALRTSATGRRPSCCRSCICHGRRAGSSSHSTDAGTTARAERHAGGVLGAGGEPGAGRAPRACGAPRKRALHAHASSHRHSSAALFTRSAFHVQRLACAASLRSRVV